jgi:ketosteroid isomerase-like protein
MKKITELLSFLTIIALTFSSCASPEKGEPIDMASLKVEIQAMEDAFSAAEKAKDADAVVVYYSENAISYSRNRQPASGRAAIRENIAKSIASDTLGGYNVYKLVDLFAEGNTALEIGSWTQFDASGTEVQNGYYMSYFEKNDGKYECIRDMNVTTKPMKDGM